MYCGRPKTEKNQSGVLTNFLKFSFKTTHTHITRKFHGNFFHLSPTSSFRRIDSPLLVHLFVRIPVYSISNSTSNPTNLLVTTGRGRRNTSGIYNISRKSSVSSRNAIRSRFIHASSSFINCKKTTTPAIS